MAHRNTMTQIQKIQRCQEILGYDFTDQDMCWEGLQSASSGVKRAGSRSIPNGCRRLAIVGQSVLVLILSEQWYQSSAAEGDIGEWNEIRQSIVTHTNLDQVGRTNDLAECVQIGNGTTTVSSKMMASTLEALLGAVFLDREAGGDAGRDGVAAVRAVMQRLGITV